MAVIVDKCADKEIIETLEKLNIHHYKSTSLDFLYYPVNTHPDMQIHFISGNTAFVAPSAYEYYRNILPENVTLYKGYSDPGKAYPEDCSYNMARMGRKIIGNMNYVDPFIKKHYLNHGYEFINVNQGYTKCNLCIVDENSAITEDEGIYRTLINNGINILKIVPGEVKLDSFKYGFIGGASGKVYPGTVCFCGDIEDTSYYKKIKSFITRRNVDIILLSENSLKDFGSILYFDDFV